MQDLQELNDNINFEEENFAIELREIIAVDMYDKKFPK